MFRKRKCFPACLLINLTLALSIVFCEATYCKQKVDIKGWQGIGIKCYDGRFLPHQYFTSLEVRSLLECFDQCLRFHGCASINYIEQANHNVCHVNSDRAGDLYQSKLKENPNSTYYEVDYATLSEYLLKEVGDQRCIDEYREQGMEESFLHETHLLRLQDQTDTDQTDTDRTDTDQTDTDQTDTDQTDTDQTDTDQTDTDQTDTDQTDTDQTDTDQD